MTNAVEGDQIELPASPGTRYFDLWHGVELHPSVRADNKQAIRLAFPLEHEGFGAILATGSQTISNAVSDQILSAAMEYAFSQRLSVFVKVPYQFVHFGPDLEDAVEPQQGNAAILNHTQFPETEVRPKQDPNGIGDVQFGFKYLF